MLTLFLSALALTSSASAERPTTPRTGNFELGARYSYFTTESNYDQGGVKTGLLNNGGLSVNQGTLSASYDGGRRWRLLSSLNYNSTSTTDGYFDRDNSALTDGGLGAQYFTVTGRFLVVPEVDGHVTFYQVSESSDQAAIAEGVNTLRGGAWAIWRLGEFQPFAYLGAEYRDAERAPLGHYVLGGHYAADALYVEGQLRGFFSLMDDADASLAGRARRSAYLQRVNGGSLRFYGVNPALTELALEAGYAIDQLKLFAGASTTVAGQSTAQGWGAWGGVRFTLGTRSRESESSWSPSPDPNGFRPAEDTYDDTIFTDRPGLGTRRPRALKPRPKPRPRRADPRLRQQENLNRLLNETEQDLEER